MPETLNEPRAIDCAPPRVTELVVAAPPRAPLARMRFLRRRPWRRDATFDSTPFMWTALPEPRAAVRSTQSLPFAVVLAATVLPLPAALFPSSSASSFEIAQSVRDLAALLWALCWLPALFYLAKSTRSRRPIPFLPVVGVLYALYYALSPMMGLSNVLFGMAPLDATTDYATPMALALGGWATLLTGFALSGFVRPAAPRSVWKAVEELRPSTLRRASFAAMAIYEPWELVCRVMSLPPGLGGVTPLLSMLALGGMIVLLVHDRRGLLSQRERLTFRLLAVLFLFIEIGGGATFRVLRFFFSVFVAIWIDRPRLRLWHVATGLTVLATAVAFRGSMHEWRERVWFGDAPTQSSLERSVIMADILRQDLAAKGAVQMVADGWHLIAHRSANTDLLADIVRRTPFEVPHWQGGTYVSLVGAFVPRLLWPTKPQKVLGQEFGHRYGYLNAHDTWTSMNLPFLVEFYANFGADGVLVGMLLLGVFFGWLNDLLNRPGQPVAFSAIATQLLLPLFVLECDLSQQIGGLPMQIAVLLVALATVLALQRASRGRSSRYPSCASY